jgi:hypothetical protein
MKLENAVKEILLNEWDPIGIRSNTNAKSEYDSYALRIVGMLYNGTNESEIAGYLDEIVNELGLKVNADLSRSVSKKICSLSER